jgi:peptidoglycan hydrolase-like protein with peptidoglycan-binding domain
MFAHADMLYRQLDPGMSGSDVSSLQTFMSADGTIYPSGLVTGYFGSLTKAGVSRFQTQNGLPSVGRVGPLTMAAINSQMGGVSNTGQSAPVINNLNINTSNNTARFQWNTSEGASALIYYGTSALSEQEASAGNEVTISGSTFLVHSDMRTSHDGTLTGLQSGTRYYFVVYVRDTLGNVTLSTQQTVITSN